jgi:hypothetical protein
MLKIFRSRRDESCRWSALAQYNAEVARGLVHTAEWKAVMAEEQRRFDETGRTR